MKIHLINDDQWILGIIARKLLEVHNRNIQIDRSTKPDYSADINYYINWQGFVKRKKSNFDMVWFSHLCGDSEIIALRKADLIVAKSKHGRKILQELGFHQEKIRIFPGIGSSTDNFKKIKIGFAGRLCYKKRKGEEELRKLVETLDRRIFKFYLLGKDCTLVDFHDRISRIGDVEIVKEDAAYFFNEIDYFLQASHIEGGSMDIVNAINTGTPIISRDIGFYYDFKTAEDYTYEGYEQLLKYFKKKEAPKLLKLEQSKINT